jgi:hypothetical protein
VVRDQLEAQVADLNDRNERAKMHQLLKKYSDFKHLAKEMGLHQDEKLLENLQLWTETFRPNGFEIDFKPEGLPDEFIFRAVLDKKWLRIQPDTLRMLYGTNVLSPWTMVGQITYLPGDGQLADRIFKMQNSDAEVDPDNPSMRDPFRNMFATTRVLERMFFESQTRIEVLVYPLAIYREALLQPRSDNV